MPDTTATIIDNVYEAWNCHDAAAIAASFAAGGVSADPLTRVDLSGDNLTNHVLSLLEGSAISASASFAQSPKETSRPTARVT
jgi:hypothetical protein